MREPAVVEVGGERIKLLPERAVWWPAERTLIVADLHLGKEHTYASVGIGIPGTVLEETLDRLGWCVSQGRARRVIIAGDMLHARAGLTSTMVERVAAWRAGLGATEFVVVPGNHDQGIGEVAERWKMRVEEGEFRETPFRFVHEPDGGDEGVYTWAGHLHPAARLSAGRDSVRLACFCVGEREAVLPAFTLFSGKTTPAGLLAEEAWVIADGRVFRAPTLSMGRR